jgi:hypothetical protein
MVCVSGEGAFPHFCCTALQVDMTAVTHNARVSAFVYEVDREPHSISIVGKRPLKVTDDKYRGDVAKTTHTDDILADTNRSQKRSSSLPFEHLFSGRKPGLALHGPGTSLRCGESS